MDQDKEMLEVVKPKEADALPVVGPGVVGDDQSEENHVEEVLQVEKTQQGNAPPDVNPVEEVLEVECLDVEMLEVVKLPKEHGANLEVNFEDEVLEVEKSKESKVLVNQDDNMVTAGKSEVEIASSEVISDVEVLEIEDPKEVDAPPSEISLHVEGVKLDDDVKKTLASKDGENKDALKDKEELLKEDDDVCEEVKEIEVGEVVLDHPENNEEVAKKVDNEENVSEKVAEVVELDKEEEEDDLQIVHESTSTTSTKVPSTSGRVLRSGTVSASAVASLEKCTICRQRLAELHRFHPEEQGVGF